MFVKRTRILYNKNNIFWKVLYRGVLFKFPFSFDLEGVKLNETKPVERIEFWEVDRRQRRFRFTISVVSAGFNCFSAEFFEK